MSQPDILVVGATGHVGAQIVTLLDQQDRRVRAFVRRKSDIVVGATDNVSYALGDLADRDSLRAALQGIQIVISTANAIVPQGRTQSVDQMADDGYGALIEEAEAAGVRQFIQSSVPSHPLEKKVPELSGKRRIEARLEASPMATTIVRNPAFTDVWLPMLGAGHAASNHAHATTSRPHGFSQMWLRMVKHLVARRGILLAPGGADHGAPLITTTDVARMMVGTVGRQDAHNRTIEAGGPEWLTWRQVADLLERKTGRKVRILPMPARMAALLQTLAGPVAPSAANIFGLVRFVASYQPEWHAPAVVDAFALPRQMTVEEYIDRHWSPHE